METPQGEIFFWKVLKWQDQLGRAGALESPYRHIVWETTQLSADTPNGTLFAKRGIYGYWDLDTLFVSEESVRFETRTAIVRCRIWGQVSFATRGARAQHAEIVDIGVTADIFDAVSARYPGVPVRHQRRPVSYTWPEHKDTTAEVVLKAMGLEKPMTHAIGEDQRRGLNQKIYLDSTAKKAIPEGKAMFRYGVYYDYYAYIGRTLRSVRWELGSLWGMPNEVDGFKGPEKLGENYIIQAGDYIEFHRLSPSSRRLITVSVLGQPAHPVTLLPGLHFSIANLRHMRTLPFTIPLNTKAKLLNTAMEVNEHYQLQHGDHILFR